MAEQLVCNYINRDHSGYGINQWGDALLCNVLLALSGPIPRMIHDKPLITQPLDTDMRNYITTEIAKFMGPTWGPPGSCRPQMGPMLAPWTLLSGNNLICCQSTRRPRHVCLIAVYNHLIEKQTVSHWDWHLTQRNATVYVSIWSNFFMQWITSMTYYFGMRFPMPAYRSTS